MARLGRSYPQSTGYQGSGIGEPIGSQAVTPNIITQTGDVFALTVNAGNSIALALLTYTGTPYALTVGQRVDLGLISSTGTPFSLVSITGGDVDTGVGRRRLRRLLFNY